MSKRSGFDEVRTDEYAVALEAQLIAGVLIERKESLQQLLDAQILYLFRDEEITSRGKVEMASAHLARLQGPSAKHWGRYIEWSFVRQFGIDPDFVMLIDRNIWDGLDLAQRTALVHHELLHMQQAIDAEGNPRFNKVTGAPIWKIAGHDIEEFDEVVADHGVWKDDVASFVRAAIDALSADIKPGDAIVAEVEALQQQAVKVAV